VQARGVAGGIIATVALMAESGLPCYGRGAPVDNLRARFRLDLSDAQAAAFMRATIDDAYDKVAPCRPPACRCRLCLLPTCDATRTTSRMAPPPLATVP
jgi:hypothetical protein